MELVIVTGLSGAGKTATLNVLEDEGFLCVDNLPTPLINDLVKLMDDMPEVDRVALALDQRNRIFTKELYNNIKELKDDLAAKVIFLNSTDEVLIKRFKERRRPHPLAPKGLIMDGIKLERDRMQKIQDISFVLDTSSLSLGELKRAVHSFLEESDDINIVFTTFGFKHGMVMDADLVFDVRFITNPYYIPELKEKSGYVDEVYDFVLNHEETREFIDRVYELLKFLIPLYEREGKEQLVVAFGCTGGRQRSVSVARRLQELFKYDGRNIILLDRDLES
ncbi:MAG: RNase adapter RapZ [Firmicutes bacterium]|nr:RNase adapter RapZ [Ezakiella sp.]MDD7761696.1 RNase adapter RapZ [Bacillota bacterium]